MLAGRDRMTGRAAALTDEETQYQVDHGGQSDQAPLDAAVMELEREHVVRTLDAVRSALDDVNDALAAMERGTYGVCAPAGRRLPEERLRALPWARVCVDCEEHRSRGRRR